MPHTMNCRNCAAPVERLSCSGVIRCTYCDSRDVLSSEGLGLDGVVFLGAPSELDCPACGDQLVSAVIDDHAVRACPGCYGVAIPQATLGLLVTARRATYRGPERPPIPIDAADLSRQRDCPICREPMELHPYYGPGNAVIDSCSSCRLVWLDVGELSAIERAPGLRRPA
jgi:Zn-finger nucleic acid-binding protein